MIKLMDLLSQIIQESKQKQLNEVEVVLFEETELFCELGDPNNSYKYKEVAHDIWEFEDRFGNILGVQINANKYVDSFFKVKNLSGKELRVFDVTKIEGNIDPNTYHNGTDERRSDTICKILRDEIIPKYLINKKPQLIKLHPLNDYRHKIFKKCANICKEKYPEIEVKEMGKEIHLINK